MEFGYLLVFLVFLADVDISDERFLYVKLSGGEDSLFSCLVVSLKEVPLKKGWVTCVDS